MYDNFDPGPEELKNLKGIIQQCRSKRMQVSKAHMTSSSPEARNQGLSKKGKRHQTSRWMKSWSGVLRTDALLPADREVWKSATF